MLDAAHPAAFGLDVRLEGLLGAHRGGDLRGELDGIGFVLVSDAVDEEAGIFPVGVVFDEVPGHEVFADDFHIHVLFPLCVRPEARGRGVFRLLFRWLSRGLRPPWTKYSPFSEKTDCRSGKRERDLGLTGRCGKRHFYGQIEMNAAATRPGRDGRMRLASGLRFLRGFFFGWCVAPLFRPRKAAAPGTLLVLRPDAIGDYVLFRDYLGWIRRHSPWRDWKIVLVGNRTWRDLAEYFDKDCYDAALWLDRRRVARNPVALVALCRRVRRLGASCALYPVLSREFLLGDMIVRASGATRRIGAVADCVNMTPREARRGDKWYTEPVMVPARGFEFLRTRDFFTALAPACAPALPLRPTFITPAPLPEFPAHAFAIFPGASTAAKRWPVEKFAELAAVAAAAGWTVLVGGGTDDRRMTARIAAAAGDKGHDLGGLCSLARTVRLVAQSRIVVTNDSCPLHIAAACGVPVVCLSNGERYGRFTGYPRGLVPQDTVFLYPPGFELLADPETATRFYSGLKIDGIRVEDVVRAVSSIVGPGP